MSTISVGDLVEGTGVSTGTKYQGVLLSLARSGYNPRIQVTKVKEAKVGSAEVGSCASIVNMRKVEYMSYSKNLVGPKPEPVQEPKFVTPFRSQGRNVIDANGTVVVRIERGGYAIGTVVRGELGMAHAHELARLFAEAVTEKYAAKVEDSKSPF